MGRKPSANLNLPTRMRARSRHGGKTFYYFDTGEKPRREIPLGSDYIEAVKKWADLSKQKMPDAVLFCQAIERYILSNDYAKLGDGTKKDYGYAFDKLREHFGDAPLDQVKPEYVRLYLDKRSLQSEHRGLREVSVMGMIFRFAMERGWCKFNPVSTIKRKKLPGRKEVYIYDGMFDAVYEKAPADLKEAMDLAYYIGQRPADVLSLSIVKVSDGILEYRQGKTHTPQRIAITGPLEELLKRIEVRKATFKVASINLLVDERGQRMTKAKLRSRFEKARSDAGIAGKDFQFRDLRSKSGSDLKDQHGLESARALLGHTSVTMTEHYTNRRRGAIITKIPVRK